VIVGVAVGGGVSVGSSTSVGDCVGERVASGVFVALDSSTEVDSACSGNVVGVADVHAIRKDISSSITNIDNDLFDMNTVISFFCCK
jgi:hypothetical protein